MTEVAILVGWAALLSYMGGPNVPYVSKCAYLADLDADGDVDLLDVAEACNQWRCLDEYTGCGAYRIGMRP